MEGCRQAKMAIKMPTGYTHREVLSLERRALKWVVALSTGHGNFGYHLKKMGLLEDDTCELCLKEIERRGIYCCRCPDIS